MEENIKIPLNVKDIEKVDDIISDAIRNEFQKVAIEFHDDEVSKYLGEIPVKTFFNILEVAVDTQLRYLHELEDMPARDLLKLTAIRNILKL